MPLVAAALADGRISVDHAWRLSVARTGHRAGAFALAEQTLVDITVEEPDFAEFLRAVQYWEHGADDQLGASADQHRRHHRGGRKAHHSATFQGTFELDTTFDAVGGEIFGTALDRIYHELLKADWKAARAEHGDAACVSDLCRTPEQRRLDALVEMARRAMAVAADAKLPRPLITVVVGYEQMHGPIPRDLQRQHPHHPPGRRPALGGRCRTSRVRPQEPGHRGLPHRTVLPRRAAPGHRDPRPPLHPSRLRRPRGALPR